MDVSVIIVNYNTKQLLYDCLKSIYTQTKEITFEVIVSDNGSVDGSIEMIKEKFPKVIIVENKENLGFGKANNIAAKNARGKYLFFLNSDTLLLNNAIKLFFDEAEACEEERILASWLLDINREIAISYGFFTTFYKHCFMELYTYFPGVLKLRRLFIRKKNRKCQKTSLRVDFVSGADLFISTNVFSRLKGFDPHIFMYYEDDDLCRRAAEIGCKSFIIESPEIVHLEGKSSNNSIKKMMIKEKSFLYYLKKYSSYKTFRIKTTMYNLFILLRFLTTQLTLSEKMDLYINTKKNIKELEK